MAWFEAGSNLLAESKINTISNTRYLRLDMLGREYIRIA